MPHRFFLLLALVLCPCARAGDEVSPPETPLAPAPPAADPAFQAEEWTRKPPVERAGESTRQEVVFGLDAYYYDYREAVDPPLKSSEHGLLVGPRGTYRALFNGGRQFVQGRLGLGFRGTTYDGTTTAGTPVQASSENFQLDAELDAGLRVVESVLDSRLELYLGVGYRYWDRGPNTYAGSYREDYSWIYFPVGVRAVLPFNEKWEFAIDAALTFPFGGTLKVFLSGYDPTLIDAEVLLISRFGWRIDFPLTWRVDREWKLALVPWFEMSRIGQSPDFPVYTVTHALVGLAHEPSSTTLRYGARLAATFTF